MNKKIASELAIGILVLIAIVLGIVFWAGGQKVQTPTIKDETAGWQTYKNNILGIEFKYPKDWSCVEYTGAQGLICQSNKHKQEEDANPNKRGDVAMGYTDLTIDINPTSAKNLNEYYKSLPYDPFDKDGTDIKLGEILLGGEKAYEVILGGYVSNYAVVSLHKGTLYSLKFLARSKESTGQDEKSILSTFKFTDSQNISGGGNNTQVNQKTNLIAEDTNIEIIHKYYSLLSFKESLQEAYNLKLEPEVSFQQFEKWYGNVEIAKTDNLIKIGEGQYKLKVDLIEKDGSGKRYDVIMQIINGKIKTISSVELKNDISGEVIFSSSLKAYVAWNDGSESVILEANGNKKTIDEIKRPNKENIYLNFKDIIFSKKGFFLTYKKLGWEGFSVSVYDIKSGKIVYSSSFSEIYGFTEKEDYFYECNPDGFAGGFVNIISVPSFKIIKDLRGDKLVYNCSGYDEKTRSIKYSLIEGEWIEGHDISYEYYFDSDRVLEKK
ncbi:MAG: PsbP-related protein [Candidatus Moranbacteria bacterium]|nr:PsbP-related protein [Candidatus Moranbacteria bacterium]